MKQRLSQLLTWLVAILIFCIASNLFLVLNDASGYINGIRIDYLLPKLFFTDFLILPIIIVGIFLKKQEFFLNLKKSTLLSFITILLIASQAFSSNPEVSFFTVLKGIELGLLFLVLLLNKEIVHQKIFFIAASTSILIQTGFALYQFIFQKSLTPYWLTGESNLSSGLIGLARSSFGGEERLLAYGTTAHPNILAGVIVLLTIIVLSNSKENIFKLLLIPCILILFLTQSWSATLALALGLVGIHKKNIFKGMVLKIVVFTTLSTPFLLFLLNSMFDTFSISRREGLQQATFLMIRSNPIIGVGINNFTVVLEQFILHKEFVRFIQPVHNSIWLWLAETGLLGLLLLWIVSKKLTEKYELHPMALTLIPILSLDHYITTTQSGLLVGIIFLIFCLKKKATRH